ncbi:MAG: DUF4012 domain-containing protein [Anaerolineae bacterium]|nr:DUF4012 domain-containing protein [Anaerolineae bacterium]
MTRKRWIGWLFVLAGLVLLALWAWQLGRTAQSLRGHVAQAQALTDAPGPIDPAAACELVQGLRGDVVDLRRQAGGLTWLGPLFGWLPEVGGTLRAAPHLLVVADGMTEAGALACGALDPLLVDLSDGGMDGLAMEEVGALLAGRQAELEQARAAVDRARQAWARVDVDALHPVIAERAGTLDRGLSFSRAGLAALVLAPELMGMDGPRTYLVVALNEDELRPGGGFISGVGEVQVEGGELAAMTFRDSYAVDDLSLPYPPAPEPMLRYMGIDLMGFRDSNWSPDFPTAARQAIALYRPGYPLAVDGVVALDQRAVQELVAALGPLEVEGADAPVTAATVVAYVRQAWAPVSGEASGLTEEWWEQRKAFMGALARSAWEQLRGGDYDWMYFALTLLQMVEEKHLLIYLEHPGAEALLAEQGWDGALRPGDGDFLLIVDANLGYNKANGRVRQAAHYAVDLQSSPPTAQLTLVYTHTSTAAVPCQPEIRQDPLYEQMMDRCYWDYLRVYIPQDSELLEAERFPVPGEWLWLGVAESGEVARYPAPEGPWSTLGVMDVLPTASSRSRSFAWTLAADAVQWEPGGGVYLLRLVRQPGAPAYPLTVRVRLPAGSSLLAVEPADARIAGDEVILQMMLERDRDIWLRWGRE